MPTAGKGMRAAVGQGDAVGGKNVAAYGLAADDEVVRASILFVP
ncbi:hypothetical protein GRPL_04142 [Raoultella planticola ATCC 33531]|nr:hypothetical protein GRPL_04142 [Raoultella planticola ATCC 33531]